MGFACLSIFRPKWPILPKNKEKQGIFEVLEYFCNKLKEVKCLNSIGLYPLRLTTGKLQF